MIDTDYQSYDGRSEIIPEDIIDNIEINPVAKNVDELIGYIEQAIGGKDKTYKIKMNNGFNYPVHIEARFLGEHLEKELGRSRYVGFLPAVIEDPYEVWMSYEKNELNGEIALKFKFIKLVKSNKNQAMMLVANVKKGVLEGWTFIPVKNAKRLNKSRTGIMIYARK